MSTCTLVVPTVARPGLRTLLLALAAAEGPGPRRLILVDDRPRPGRLPRPAGLPFPCEVLRSYGRGPAAARNLGWRAADTEWVVFLDDEAVPSPTWFADLATDLAPLTGDDGASQGRIEAPPHEGRPPTGADQGIDSLERPRWTTADMAYRREALQAVSGFDERFTRACREGADLALRVVDAGWRISGGERLSRRPARPRGFLASVRDQAGNADNALMRAKHGFTWRQRSGERPARFLGHLVTTGLGAAAVAGALRRRRWASIAAAAWGVQTARFAASRTAPGTRNPVAIADTALSSAVIPPLAVFWNAIGTIRHRPTARPDAILFDRDDTLVADGPHPADAERVRPMPGAEVALRRLRAARVPVGVVTDQPGVAEGLITPEELEAVNRRVDDLLGPFDVWKVCPHGPEDGCACRKPAPGAIQAAAAELGARPERCIVIGHTGADVAAALAAGARAVLVPAEATSPSEIAEARLRAAVAEDLCEAVNLALGDIA